VDNSYSKRRQLPHFDKPWAIYYITIATRSRRVLSPSARDEVLAAARHFHGRRYDLFAACVMPDHAHLLLQPWFKEQRDGGENIFWPLGELMHSIKSFTAKKINALEGSHGPVWQEERYDRYVRGDHDLREKFNYILENPERAKLVEPGADYSWIWTPDADAARPDTDAPGKMPGTAGGTPTLPGN
jgi:putative transposase